jgi:hypothetical protein
MKLKKGLPADLMFIAEHLQPLVKKMDRLGDRDLRELEAFIDYLLKVPGEAPGDAERKEPHKMFDFMNGGLEKKQDPGQEP